MIHIKMPALKAHKCQAWSSKQEAQGLGSVSGTHLCQPAPLLNMKTINLKCLRSPSWRPQMLQIVRFHSPLILDDNFINADTKQNKTIILGECKRWVRGFEYNGYYACTSIYWDQAQWSLVSLFAWLYSTSL